MNGRTNMNRKTFLSLLSLLALVLLPSAAFAKGKAESFVQERQA